MSNFEKLIKRNSDDVLKPLKFKEHIYSVVNILECFKLKKSKLLLVGEVQSGKTRRIIDIIKYSLNNAEFYFDVIIVFGGTTNDLNDQTEIRFKNGESGLGTEKNIRFKSFNSTYSEKQDGNKMIIYIGPKLNKALENIETTIMDIPNLKDKKILIIDDESDYGSINTKKFGDSSKYAKIIENLYDILPNNGSGFISITATPYANLLNKKTLSYNHIFALPCMKKYHYTGITYFNSLKDFYINTDNDDLWKNIGYLKTVDVKKIYFGFCVYILNTIIKSEINEENFASTKSDWLVNTDYVTDKHSCISRNLENIISDCKNSLPSFIDKLEFVNKLLNKNATISIENVQNILNKINLIILNSHTEYSTTSHYNIFIGGVKLSRGITYENLTLEYITNFPKKIISADTLLQMCRWFGYRKHLDKYSYMNVITTSQGIMALKEIEKYNDLFYEYANESDNGGKKDIQLTFKRLYDLEKSCSYVRGCNVAKK